MLHRLLHAIVALMNAFRLVHNWQLRAACLQVVDSSDVLFLFGSVQEVKDTITRNLNNLKDGHILVPVTQDGSIEEYQVHLSLGAISHCFIRLTHVFPQVRYVQFCNDFFASICFGAHQLMCMLAWAAALPPLFVLQHVTNRN